jgi:hypothetical protein
MRVLDIAAGRLPSDSVDVNALCSHALPHASHPTPEEDASGVMARAYQQPRLDDKPNE